MFPEEACIVSVVTLVGHLTRAGSDDAVHQSREATEVQFKSLARLALFF